MYEFIEVISAFSTIFSWKPRLYNQQYKKGDTMNTTVTNLTKSGFIVALTCIICLSGFETTDAQNPANGIEASGITISEDARTVVVEPDNYPAEVGNLNETIESEIAVDPNTIFILQRDEVYWTLGRIENENFRLHLKAEDGEGHPPIIRPAVDLGQSVEMINSTRDVILEGILFQGMNEDGAPENTLVHVGEDAIIIADNCWFVGSFHLQLRIDGSNNAIYATNNLILNGGRNGSDQQGRFLDTIGNDQDTVYIENNSIYNMGHAFIRNSGGIIDHLYINHNTVMNISQYIRVGETQNMYIKNNIFRNVYTIGESVDEDTRAWVEIREQPEGFDEQERVLVYSHNNSAYLDEGFLSLIETRNDHHADDTIMKAPDVSRKYMDSSNELPLVTYENNIEEKVDFTNPPNTDPQYLDWTKQWMMGRDGVPFGDDPQPIEVYDHIVFYDQWEGTSEEPAPGHFNVDLIRDFSYSSDFESYTAAENGFPLGDLNWFPELKEQWIAGEVVSVEEPGNLAKEFKLIGNYPNPFNPTTNIVYELPVQAEVTMEIYNMLGQSVNTVELGAQFSGRHEFTLNAGNLPSGIYIIRMQAGKEILTHRVTLIK